MNDRERELIQWVVNGDIRRAQQCARLVLDGVTAKKDEQFKANMIRKLDAKGSVIELPFNLQHLLVAEDMASFPVERFLLRPEDEAAVGKVLDLYRVSERLAEMGIPYLPAMILHGQSGCGKTMFARYVAHKANMPFIYVKFSRLIDSYLGKTNENLGRIFDYVRSAPCVLCFDEIDAIGMARGQASDVGEMNRIVIALMQEMDRLPNNVIIIGTTNRFDRLDPALVRRFPVQYEMMPLSAEDSEWLARKFFAYTGIEYEGWVSGWCKDMFGDGTPAATVVKECTSTVVQKVIEDQRI